MSAIRLAALAVLVMCLSTSVAAWPAPLPVDVLPGQPHAPIVIDGDAQFTAANGVRSGSGTQADPYVIRDWWILTTASTALVLRNTGAHVLIEDVSAALPTDDVVSSCNAFCLRTKFIQLDGVENVTLSRVDAGETAIAFEVLRSHHISFWLPQSGSDAPVMPRQGAEVGISLWQSSDVTIRGLIAKNVEFPVMVVESTDVTIAQSLIDEGSTTIRDSQRVVFEANLVRGGSVGFETSQAITLADNGFRASAEAIVLPSGRSLWGVYLDRVNDAIVCGNDIVGSADSAITLMDVDGAHLTGNRFADGFTGVAAWGLGIEIEHNLFERNTYGVVADGEIAVHLNAFVQNDIGVWADHGVSATNNWWGHQTGPSGDGVGSGDPVYGATYAPWLSAAPPFALTCA